MKSASPSLAWNDPKRVDLALLFAVVALLLFGLLMVFSSSFIFSEERTGNGFFFIRKQLIFAGVGVFAAIFGFLLKPKAFERLAVPLLGMAYGFLVLVRIPGIGHTSGGAQRWIHLAGVQIQPAEFVKFCAVVFVASVLSKLEHFRGASETLVWKKLLWVLPLFLLILLQPDFGSVAILGSTVICLLFVGGIRLNRLFGVLVGFAVICGVLILLKPYRFARLMTFLDPWRDPAGAGFQIIQSLVGIHRGQIFGVGLGNGKEKLFYLPEAHNDFIFAVIGEELGFFGVASLVLLFLFVVYRSLRGVWTRFQIDEELFPFLLGVGIACLFGLQAFVNFSVALGLVPTKGLTLPLVSYGGSSLVVTLFEVGVLLRLGTVR